MEQKINELEINGVTYVRKDSIKNEVINKEGLKAVLVRTYSAGVHYGYLKSYEDTPSGRVVVLVDTRRIWCWSGAASLSQMSVEGVKNPDKCRFSIKIPENEIVNAIEIIPLSEKALQILNDVPEWKNN